MALVPWLLAVVIGLVAAVVHYSGGASRDENQANLAQIQANAEVQMLAQDAAHAKALEALLAQTAEITAQADAVAAEAGDFEAEADAIEAKADQILASREAAAAPAAAAKMAAVPQTTAVQSAVALADTKADAAAQPVSLVVPYTELLRPAMEALMDTDVSKPDRLNQTRLSQAAEVFRTRAAAGEMDADTAKSALIVLGIMADLQKAKAASRDRYIEAASFQPPIRTSNERDQEAMRLAGVERGQRNASAEYGRAFAVVRGQIITQMKAIRRGEDEVQAAMEASATYAARHANDSEHKDLQRQVEKQEEKLEALRTQLTDLRPKR